MTNGPIEPKADFQQAARELFGIHTAPVQEGFSTALVQEGFSEQQALVILGQMLAANGGGRQA